MHAYMQVLELDDSCFLLFAVCTSGEFGNRIEQKSQ